MNPRITIFQLLVICSHKSRVGARQARQWVCLYYIHVHSLWLSVVFCRPRWRTLGLSYRGTWKGRWLGPCWASRVPCSWWPSTVSRPTRRCPRSEESPWKRRSSSWAPRSSLGRWFVLPGIFVLFVDHCREAYYNFVFIFVCFAERTVRGVPSPERGWPWFVMAWLAATPTCAQCTGSPHHLSRYVFTGFSCSVVWQSLKSLSSTNPVISAVIALLVVDILKNIEKSCQLLFN